MLDTLVTEKEGSELTNPSFLIAGGVRYIGILSNASVLNQKTSGKKARTLSQPCSAHSKLSNGFLTEQHKLTLDDIK
jgi:hypothetical protein